VIDGRMQEALNKQINAELYSSYLYLSMSAYFQSVNLTGFAHWMRVQAREELAHAMKFYDHVIERGGTVTLQPVEVPASRWDSPLAAFEDAYRHEQKVTGLINQLVDEAVQTRDHATNTFLQWFVTEQVEEEASADAIVQKLKLVGDAPGGLFMIDHELAQRASGQPSTAA
jgi:ferritin